MRSINETLSTFLKIAITVTTIAAFIFGTMYLTMDDFSDHIADYIESAGGGTYE